MNGPAKRGRPLGAIKQAQLDAEAASLARDCESAKVNPTLFLGDAYYQCLVRENKAGEALANAAATIPNLVIGGDYRAVLLAALAGAAMHAKAYHDGMTPKRKKALQDIKEAEEMLAQARKELLAAEAEEGAFPTFPV